MFTFIGEKKEIFVITLVDRLTLCYLGFRVVWNRTQTVWELVDQAPPKASQRGTTVMPSNPMTTCGTTGACTKSRSANGTPARWKRIMPICATIWLAWGGVRAVFRAAPRP